MNDLVTLLVDLGMLVFFILVALFIVTWVGNKMEGPYND